MVNGSNETKVKCKLGKWFYVYIVSLKAITLLVTCYFMLWFILDPQIQFLSKNNDISVQPGSVVYMTAFVGLNEMYVRKLEDYNDEYHQFLDKVHDFCLSGINKIKLLQINLYYPVVCIF